MIRAKVCGCKMDLQVKQSTIKRNTFDCDFCKRSALDKATQVARNLWVNKSILRDRLSKIGRAGFC